MSGKVYLNLSWVVGSRIYEHAEELASDNPVLRLVCSWVDKLILEWRNPRMNRLGVFLGGSLDILNIKDRFKL